MTCPGEIKRGGHFGVLTGMWVFQNITLHRATNSAKSQASYIESHFMLLFTLICPSKCVFILMMTIPCIFSIVKYRNYVLSLCTMKPAPRQPSEKFTNFTRHLAIKAKAVSSLMDGTKHDPLSNMKAWPAWPSGIGHQT